MESARVIFVCSSQRSRLKMDIRYRKAFKLQIDVHRVEENLQV